MGAHRIAFVLLLVTGCAASSPAVHRSHGPGEPPHSTGPAATPRQLYPPRPSLAAPPADRATEADGQGAARPQSGAASPSAAPPAGSYEGAPAADGATPAAATAEIDDDELETPTEPAARIATLPPALAKLSDRDLAQALESRLPSLGPMSVGWTNSGALVNGVLLPANPRYSRMDDVHAWATQETIDYLRRAIDVVIEKHRHAPQLYVGHLSGRRGGHLKPHKSHQSGRDVDTSFYYLPGKHRWYRVATAKTLDCELTWTFVRALLTETDVQMIFINTSVQRLLKDHALRKGEDPEWLDSVFQYKSKHPNPIIRHARGHQTHIHIRFYNPVAQELGRRAYPMLVKMGKLKPRTYYVTHRAKKGDTLGALARKYRTTIKAIQRANKLRTSKIFAKKVYRIPRAGPVRASPRPVQIPPRRLPPSSGGPAPGRKSTAASAAHAP